MSVRKGGSRANEQVISTSFFLFITFSIGTALCAGVVPNEEKGETLMGEGEFHGDVVNCGVEVRARCERCGHEGVIKGFRKTAAGAPICPKCGSSEICVAGAPVESPGSKAVLELSRSLTSREATQLCRMLVTALRLRKDMVSVVAAGQSRVATVSVPASLKTDAIILVERFLDSTKGKGRVLLFTTE